MLCINNTMGEENITKLNIRPNLPWIIPTIISIIFGGYQIWGLVDRVAKLESHEIATIQRVYDIEHRINRVEEFCCSEIQVNKCTK